MRYTLRYILDNRYDEHRSNARKISERFVFLNIIVKALSPYPTFVFLNFGVHPDWITFVGLLFIVSAAVLLTIGHVILAVIALLCFVLLDSVDGDMARCLGPTSYGGILDSFGADFFYAFIPVSAGYYLYSIGTHVGSFPAGVVLLVSAFVSISFLLYRIINEKAIRFTLRQSDAECRTYSELNEWGGLLRLTALKLIKLYRHEIIKGNFFSEAGMILWFSILLLTGSMEFLGLYLIIILFYNVGYLLQNFIRTYITFLHHEKGFEVT